MKQTTTARTLTALVGAGALLSTGAMNSASAQAENDNVLLGFSHAGCEAIFDDPNDAGLRQAFELLMPRFMELRNGDTPMSRDLQQIPTEVLESVVSLITSPMTMVVTGSPEPDPDTGAPIFHALISFDMDKDEADRMHQTVQMLTQMGPGGPEFEESERFAGMMQTFTPMGPLSFGPREAADGWRYEILFGPDIKPDMIGTLLPESPPGVRQLASGVIDLEALSPLTRMGTGFLAMASPQGAQAVEQIEKSGLVGEGAMRFELTSWTDGQTNTTQVISERARNFREAMYLPDSTLTPADFAIIPPDATAASISKFSPGLMIQGIIDQVSMSNPDVADEIDEVLAEIEEQTGIDVMGEFVPALGETFAAYFADSTGGGSLLSGVVAIKSADKDKLKEIMARVEGIVGAMWDEEDPSEGVLRPRAIRTTHNGREMVTYRVSGLPLPVAPSMTIVGDWFVMGLSPQAAMAAADHTGRNRGRGLLDNPRFAAAYRAQPDTVSVSFVDTHRTLRDGYTTLNLLGTAFGNLVCSSDPDGPAVTSVVPTLGSLTDGCQPLIQQSFWRGDDLVQWSTSDHSALVSLASLLGVGDAAPLIGGMILGGGIGAAIVEEMGGGYNDWDSTEWDDDWDDDWDEDDDWEDEKDDE
ncbi:MAG: hypothetical protein Tsb0013_18780 [Phycisphaerales bacterium]